MKACRLGTRMAAFTEQDELGNTYTMTGDHAIEDSVSAVNDTSRHAPGIDTVFPLKPLLLLFPNASPGARLRLHFRWSASLGASVATGREEHALSGEGTVLVTR